MSHQLFHSLQNTDSVNGENNRRNNEQLRTVRKLEGGLSLGWESPRKYYYLLAKRRKEDSNNTDLYEKLS